MLLHFLMFECKTGGKKKKHVTTLNGKWIWHASQGCEVCTYYVAVYFF